MRFLIVLVAAILASCQSAKVIREVKMPRMFEEQIKNTIHCIQKELAQGIPEVCVPPIDPLDLNDFTINFDKIPNSVISGYIHVQNFLLTGIAHWDITYIDGTVGIIPPKYTLEYTAEDKQVSVNGDYDLDIVYNNTHISGKGHVKGQVANDKISGNMIVKFSQPHLQDFNVEIKVNTASLDVNGLMVNGVDVSDKLNEIGNNLPEYLEKHGPEISAKIRDIIMNIVNHQTRDGNADCFDRKLFVQILKTRCSPIFFREEMH